MYHLWFSGPAAHLFLNADATGNILPSLGRVLRRPGDRDRHRRCRSGSPSAASPVVTSYLNPLLQFVRALPVVTMAPVFIVLFKIGTEMEVATIAFGTVWPILLNTIDGAAARGPRAAQDRARVPADRPGSGWPGSSSRPRCRRPSPGSG